MSNIAKAATQLVMNLLGGEGGVRWSVEGSADPSDRIVESIHRLSVTAHHAPAELLDRNPTQYPVLSVYCEKLSNNQQERFRAFSGTAEMAIEIRVTAERIEDIGEFTTRLTDAVTLVLGGRRGDWGQGIFYGGGYEVLFQPVKKGGRNYLQTAKVRFSLQISE
jgi:hypothetical protein